MTPYSTINSFFLGKISDYSYLNLTTADLDNTLQGYMHSAVTKFKKCKQDLTQYDDNLKQFTATLTDQEIEIISMLMLVEYLTPKIINTELLKLSLTSRDFNQTSQSNQLRSLLAIRDNLIEEIDLLIIRYSFDNADLSQFQ